MRLAFVTHAGAPALTADDRLAARALERRGAAVAAAVWSDPSVAWARFDAVVLRSSWDYHLVPDDFARWLARAEAAGARILNPPPLVRWNMRKTYLRDLAARGVATVPTHVVERGTSRSLAEVLDAAGWDEAVVKPVVSATAHETWRTSRASARGADEARFRAMTRADDVLVQPFVPEVARDGEWSLVFLGGAFSHAVLKRPAAGDFRVQSDFGGSHEARAPGAGLVAAAARAVAAAPARPTYARVDGVCVDGRLLLMELELIEPALFLAADAAAPERFADAILAALGDAPAPAIAASAAGERAHVAPGGAA